MTVKEKIQEKINEIIESIISKPAGEITLDDYTVLTNELHDIRARESQAKSGKRMAELMANAFSDPDAFSK